MYTSIDILDIYTKNRFLVVMRNMLREISSLFERFGIIYWMDSTTLLGAIRYKDVIPWDDSANFILLESEEHKIESLNNILNEMGYGLTKFWGGFKIYPLNGIDIKYYDRDWKLNETTREIEDKNFFSYKYQFINI